MDSFSSLTKALKVAHSLINNSIPHTHRGTGTHMQVTPAKHTKSPRERGVKVGGEHFRKMTTLCQRGKSQRLIEMI